MAPRHGPLRVGVGSPVGPARRPRTPLGTTAPQLNAGTKTSLPDIGDTPWFGVGKASQAERMNETRNLECRNVSFICSIVLKRRFRIPGTDWLSRLLEMMPVRGQLDRGCSYGAPWRMEKGPGGRIPQRSAVLEDPAGGRPVASVSPAIPQDGQNSIKQCDAVALWFDYVGDRDCLPRRASSIV
jgi:hypothetical protein